MSNGQDQRFSQNVGVAFDELKSRRVGDAACES